MVACSSFRVARVFDLGLCPRALPKQLDLTLTAACTTNHHIDLLLAIDNFLVLRLKRNSSFEGVANLEIVVAMALVVHVGIVFQIHIPRRAI